VNPKKKLFLLFLLDCFVISLFLLVVIFTVLRHWSGVCTLALFLVSLYNLTRHYTRTRLDPPRKTTLPEIAKHLAFYVGVVLLLVAVTCLKKDALDPLLTNIPFLILVWVLGLLACFYRFACDLEKLKSFSAA
jgi:hypothetical protein